MTSRKKQMAKAQKVRERAASPEMSSAEKLTATTAAKTRTAKAAPVNGKATVQGELMVIFCQPEPPEAEAIIARVLKATGRALKLSTLKLYRAKFNGGGLGPQKGIVPKTKCPILRTAAK